MLTLTEETKLANLREDLERVLAASSAGASDARAPDDGTLLGCGRAIGAAATLTAYRCALEHVKAVRRELGDDPDAAIEVMLPLTNDIDDREDALEAVLAELKGSRTRWICPTCTSRSICARRHCRPRQLPFARCGSGLPPTRARDAHLSRDVDRSPDAAGSASVGQLNAAQVS